MSSASRALACQCAASGTQSVRAATYVHTRTLASRCINVSISPSTRLSAAICPPSHSAGSFPPPATWPNTLAHNFRCVSSDSFLKSGIWQASHNTATRRRPRAIARISASRAKASRVATSVASLPRTRPRRGGGAFRLSSSVSTVAKSSAALRQANCSNGSNWCSSTARTMSSSSGGHSPVVPNVPSRIPRPARPAICATSLASRCRGRCPSNFVSRANATWSTSMFSPIPIASVATRKSTSPA